MYAGSQTSIVGTATAHSDAPQSSQHRAASKLQCVDLQVFDPFAESRLDCALATHYSTSTNSSSNDDGNEYSDDDDDYGDGDGDGDETDNDSDDTYYAWWWCHKIVFGMISLGGRFDWFSINLFCSFSIFTHYYNTLLPSQNITGDVL